ncbi:MAG: RtcB family protein [Desulfobacteraceae bacterium]
MEIKLTNISAEPEGILHSWLPISLAAEHVVFLPDACPGKSPLPTGTAVLTKQTNWRLFAVSDCGCGMRLLKSSLKQADLTQNVWDDIAYAIKENKGGLGDLGGGNHFVDALLPYDEDYLFFLIHTGSRHESGLVDNLTESPDKFDMEFERVVKWAAENRAKVQNTLERIIGSTDLILDLPHNTFEKLEDSTIIRKGSVRLMPGDLAIIPSHMSGDASLIKATPQIEDILFSMSHGTGRTMSRSKAKEAATTYDFDTLRKNVLLPTFLNPASLNTEGPFAYRDLDECLNLISGYVEEVKRFSVIAYAGHL